MKIDRKTKFQLVLGLVLFASCSVFAQEGSDASGIFSSYDNSRSATDLMFMTNAGQGVTFANYSSATNEVEVKEQSTKQLYAKSKDTTGDVSIISAYGISDRLYALLKLGYLVAKDSKVQYGPASTSNGVTENTRSQGFEDIELGAKYRLLEQDATKVNLDIGLSYSPKLQTGKNAEVGKKGDAFRGGDQTGLVLQVGNKFQNFSYMLEAALNIYGERTTKDSTSTYKTTGGNELSIRLMGQYRFNEYFLADFGFGRGSVDPTKLESDSGSVTKEKSADGYGIFLSGYVAINPGSEFVSIDYSHVTLGQHNLESGGTTYSAGESATSRIGLRFISSF